MTSPPSAAIAATLTVVGFAPISIAFSPILLRNALNLDGVSVVESESAIVAEVTREIRKVTRGMD